jgi:hypothetical protein
MMKRNLLTALMLAILSIGLWGCSDTSKTSKETTVKTPGGTTTTTESKKVEKSGENPPPAQK